MSENKSIINDEELNEVTGGTILPYIALPGDSLSSVAKKFHVKEEQICRWNSIAIGSILSAGQKLIIKI